MASTSLSGPKTIAGREYFPVRPAFGNRGTAVVVWANYFSIKVKDTNVFYKYNIEVLERTESGSTKEVKGRKLQLVIQKLVDQLVSEAKPIASEYKSALVALEELELAENPVRVEIPREGGEGDDVFAVTLHEPRQYSMDQLADYLTTQDRGAEDHLFPRYPEWVDSLNIVMGYTPRSNADISAVGSARFFPFSKTQQNPLSSESSLWEESLRPLIAARGFFQSTRIATGRLLLNANVTCGVFKLAGPLTEIFERLKLDNIALASPKMLREAAKFLPKTRVRVKMIVGKGKEIWKNKAIFNLAMKSKITRMRVPNPPQVNPKIKEFAGPNDVKFWKEEEKRYITVAEHFRQSECASSRNGTCNAN